MRQAVLDHLEQERRAALERLAGARRRCRGQAEAETEALDATLACLAAEVRARRQRRRAGRAAQALAMATGGASLLTFMEHQDGR